MLPIVRLAVMRSLLVVTVGAAASVPAQVAPDSRADDTPVVDSAIVGLWNGRTRDYGLFDAVALDVGPLGAMKAYSRGSPAAYLVEAYDGRWRAVSASLGCAEIAGTYEVRRDGRLHWRNLWTTAPIMKRMERSDHPALPNQSFRRSDLSALRSLPKMLETLEDADPLRRSIASLLLAILARESPKRAVEAVPALARHLKDSAADVRWHCVIALNNLGDDGAAAGGQLLELVVDPDSDVRHAAVTALRSVVGDPALVAPALVRALADAEAANYQAAAQELREMGGRAAFVVPEIAKLAIVDPRRAGPRHTLVNLDRASAAVAAPIIVEALTRDRRLVWALEDVIRWLGPLASGAVPTIVEVLVDRSAPWLDRTSAAECLGAIGQEASSAVPALTGVVSNAKENWLLRDAAKEALARIRPSASSRRTR
jgi:HEAT repeat protein